jgi:hypothetical protein
MADVSGKFYSAVKVRTGVSPSSPGVEVGETLPPVNPPGTSLNSVGLTMPSAFAVANSPLTSNGTIAVTGAGTVAQYVRGDGTLADFPESSGGGSSVSYYLNGSVSQGTIGGVAYLEMNKVPILGAGTDFTRNSNGYIASFITDAGDPNLLEIPGGNWNFESYFSASSGGGSPTFYVELYKVNAGGTATLIASNSANPELISFGTTIAPYFSSLAVPTTTLALTDRLTIRYYVTPAGRTLTLHTEGPHLCQIITTFTTGLTALNGLTTQVQFFAVGTSGTDFNIASATATHTFNLPTASATNRGALSSADWALFTQAYNDKINSASVTGTTTKTLTLTQQDGGTITASWTDLNTDAVISVFGRTGAVVAANGDYTTAQVTESGNLYYTDGRARGALSFAAGSGAYNTSTGVITIPTNNNQITNGAGYITSSALSGYVQGSGSAGQVAYWSSSSAITGESNLFWDASNDRLGIGINTPKAITEINSGANASAIRISDQNYDGSSSTFRFTVGSYWSRSDGIIRTGTNPLDGNGSTAAIVFTDEPGNFTFNNVVRSSSIEFYTANNNVSGSVGILPTLRFKIASNGEATFSSSVTASSLIKSGGTSSEFLKADGSVDSISYVPSSRTITINGTTQDLSANRTFNVGTVTNVTATSPLFSSGGSTPNITIQQASGSQNGFLSSTDWTTFNNKQSALTNPVTGTGTSGQVAYFTGTSAISGESNLFWDASNDKLGIGTNTPATTLEVNGVGLFSGTSLAGNTKNGVYILDQSIISLAGGNSRVLNIQSQTLSIFTGTSYTEKVKVFENGNVVISTSPVDAGFKLDVNGTGRFVNGVNMATTSGNVGIGTSSPANKLQVNVNSNDTSGFADASYPLHLKNTSTTVNSYVGIYFGGGFGVGATIESQFVSPSTSSEGTLKFATRNSSGNLAERMRITSGGNVLIGTTTDSGGNRKLQVNGETRTSLIDSEEIIVTLGALNAWVNVKTFGTTDKRIFIASVVGTSANKAGYAYSVFSKAYDGTNSNFVRSTIASSDIGIDRDSTTGVLLRVQATGSSMANEQVKVKILYLNN